jgi:hypothetical protein
MEARKFEELETRASAVAEDDRFPLMRKLEARMAVQREIAAMKAAGEAHELSEEEVRLLMEFRRFKGRCKPGQLFQWQTRPAEGVTLHTDTSLIHDPQGVR